jgi:uncharacterized protein YraI
MPKLPVSGRTAVLGGVVAATTAALAVAMAGPALAAGGKLSTCTEQVRVRSQPRTTAPVVGTCKAGEKVTVDETRNGFVHAVNKEGWISSDYIATSHPSSSHPSSSHPSSSRPSSSHPASSTATHDDSSSSATSDDPSTSDTRGAADDTSGDNVDGVHNGDNSDHAGHDDSGGGFLGL